MATTPTLFDSSDYFGIRDAMNVFQTHRRNPHRLISVEIPIAVQSNVPTKKPTATAVSLDPSDTEELSTENSITVAPASSVLALRDPALDLWDTSTATEPTVMYQKCPQEKARTGPSESGRKMSNATGNKVDPVRSSSSKNETVKSHKSRNPSRRQFGRRKVVQRRTGPTEEELAVPERYCPRHKKWLPQDSFEPHLICCKTCQQDRIRRRGEVKQMFRG
ncbi:hypothetical protein K440DRAFT_640168 [Wilcoxina mikolae CBS 423.85]|nr:hypothetical protein K440DRAFT_640168 [Wilcoxina mikolae CBS 423.85]